LTQARLTALRVDPANSSALDLMAAMHLAAFSLQGEAPWKAQAFLDVLSGPRTDGTIFYEDETPVGFAVVRTVCDEAELITFAVHPAYQQRGFGQKILTLLFRRLAEKDTMKLFLEVRKDNIAANKVYLNAGFRQVGVRTGYYKLTSGKKMDALVYSLDL
jgi:ribosomal-protein-alanine N-acetyltransferase